MKRIFFVIVAGVLASAPASAASLPISVLSNCAQPTARTSLDDQIRACTLIIETPGSDAEYMLAAHLARALAYEEKGDFDKAIVDYTAALALQPNDDFYLARAECYQKKGDFERALADINALIQAKPNYAPAYSTRGKVYAAKKDFPRALADCTRATELAPQDASTWTLRARLYGQMGDEDRALSDLSRAIALEPDNTDLRHYRGLMLMRRKDYRGAISDFDRIIAIQPTADAYAFRGAARLYLGELDAAIADAEYAINLNPNVSLGQQILREAQAAKARGQPRN